MTAVIGGGVRARYRRRIMSESRQDAGLAPLIDAQRAIEARLHAGGRTPHDVLAVGRDVLAFAAREEDAFESLLPLLDQSARGVLEQEHEHLDEDLRLLEWLLANTPDSPDVTALADSLARRMAEHLERDGRLLARAAALKARRHP